MEANLENEVPGRMFPLKGQGRSSICTGEKFGLSSYRPQRTIEAGKMLNYSWQFVGDTGATGVKSAVLA